MSRILMTLAAVWAIAASPAMAQSQPQAGGVEGVWANPSGSVRVRAGACGDKVCGWVVWASSKAQDDARKAGAPPLIGTALLRGYRANGAAQWTGQVWVPDRKQAYYSTIRLVDAQTLKVSGCILGGLICKSQLWRRVPSAGAVLAR